MMYELPRSVEVCGVEYEVRTDYRDVLNIFGILNDANLTVEEKYIGILGIFFLDFLTMPAEHFEEGLKKCFDFINCGHLESCKKTPKLMDWEQDFQYLVAPMNRVAGKEIRAVEYLHWWTFISLYYEIGDCYFAQIVRIRDLKMRGKLKDKADKEFYRKNKEVVDIKRHYSDAEKELIDYWT